MSGKVRAAVRMVNNILSQPNGSDLMYIGGIYYSLSLCELENPLTMKELAVLTGRVYEACGTSAVPLLTAERTDAVRFMLENGISDNHSPEFTSINADQARELLLSCDQEVFTDLVDAFAIDSQDYYSSDFNVHDSECCKRINAAISAVVGDVPSLDEVVKAAEVSHDYMRHPDWQPGKIWDETEERYF